MKLEYTYYVLSLLTESVLSCNRIILQMCWGKHSMRADLEWVCGCGDLEAAPYFKFKLN